MKPVLGIRREDKNAWERRVPFTPADVGMLVKSGTEVVIQPSDIRAFPDRDYRAAGARVQEDLSACTLVAAVKEIPLELLKSHQTYLFFSHTIKGQPYNMPMLRRLMELRCQLFDYECVTDAQHRRLIFFGRFAGLAGMIDTLWALGRRLSRTGQTDLFAAVKMAHEYGTLDAARGEVTKLGERIRAHGLPADITPLVVGITGYGNVSRGAQEILDLLPCEELPPAQLAARRQTRELDGQRIYKVVFKEEDLVEPAGAGYRFELQDYYDHPARYRSRFESYLPYLTVLVNCIFWAPRYPRLVTRGYLKSAWARPHAPRLQVIGDISCDIEGSIECTLKGTDPGDPVYVYEPASGTIRSGVEGPGPVIMAVDNLPCELALDASAEFSAALSPFVPALAAADYTRPFLELALPAEFHRALIVHQGRLTPDYQHLAEFLQPSS